MTTILAILEDKLDEGMGYTTYIFRNLEENKWNLKYKMVTRCPNWDHRAINIGEEGFLTYQDCKAGETTWYDGKDFHYYKTTMSQFMKFIARPKQVNTDYVM